MLVNVKPIKRNWIYDSDYKEVRQGETYFIATGQWGDGKIAYSMLDQNGNIVEEHDSAFYQIRSNGKLLMVRF